MKIYHGSKEIIREVKYKGSDPKNDYGPCFYVTNNYKDACIWACKHNTLGFVNEYDVDLRGLKILDLTDKTKFSVLNWIAILLKFRELDHTFCELYKNRITKIIERYYINIEDYDVILGYRADDAYFRFPKVFVEGNLSVEMLEKVFLLGELGTQYAFVSEKAIKRITFKSYNEVSEEYICQYYRQVLNATNVFDKLLKENIESNEGTFIGDLLK